MGAFADWRRRRAAREALRSGDPWVCPYCRAVHPAFEVGGTKFAFGYPSVKFGCCGKVAFQYMDPHTRQLLRFVRIGDGVTDWMPTDAYFAWVEEQSKARGRRETSPHKELLAQEGPRTPRAKAQPQQAQAQRAVVEAAPPQQAKPLVFVAVAKVDEVKDGTGRVVEVNGQRIALFRSGQQFHAIADRCAHQARSLGEGVFEEGIVTCNGHGWRYDVRTGKAEHNPDLGVATYQVRVEDGKVLVGA